MKRSLKYLSLILVLALLICLCAACSGGDTAPTDPTSTEKQHTEPSVKPTEPTEPPVTYVNDGYEYAIFPMDYLQITQTSHEGTHECNWAVDLAGSSRGIDEYYAPFTCRIVRIQHGYNIVWAESVAPVHLANGELSIVNMLLEHDDNIDGLYEGQIIKQGEVFYDEGTAGNADGNHVHVEFALGPYVDQGCYHAEDGRVANNDGVPISEILFLTNSTQIVDNEVGGFVWKKLPVTNQQIIASGFACQGNGHAYQKSEIRSMADCEQLGLESFTCLLCNEKFTTGHEPSGHVWQETERVQPDPMGYVRYTCSTCGATRREVLWKKPHQASFTDVDEADKPYVASVCRREDMAGFEDSDTIFNPLGSVDRVEVIQVLYERGGTPGIEPDFPDVWESDDYYDAVGWAVAQGLATNTEGDRFSPEAPVTRNAALQMVCGYMRNHGVDVTKSGFRTYADWAVDAGILNASDNLRGALTRRECARLLVNMYVLLEE